MAKRRNRNRNRRKQGKPQHHAQGNSPANATPETQSAAAAESVAGVASHGAGDSLFHRVASMFGGSESRLFTAIATLMLCLLIAGSYYPAIWAGFIWDDLVLTKGMPIHTWQGIKDIWFDPRTLDKYEGHYWPLLYTTFWLEHKIWGLTPMGFHVVNVVMHAGVTLLLWRLLLSFGLVAGVSWFAAALFAVHPLHAESVVWIIGRKDVLCTLFYLWAVLSYTRFVGSGKQFCYGLSLVLFVMSLLSKSVSVTLPAVLLVWHWWRQGNVTVRDVMRVLPFFLIGFAIAFADWVYYRNIDTTAFEYSQVERALIAARSLWFYVWKLFLPLDLSVVYTRWEITLSDVVGWLSFVAALVFAASLWVFRNSVYVGRGALACALFFAITLAPTLGFLDYSYMLFAFVADRYQYLAGAGIIVMFASALYHIFGKHLRHGTAFPLAATAIAVAMLVGLGSLTWDHATIYRDKETFFKHIIAHNPKARSAHYNLGNEYRRLKRWDEAVAMYTVALTKRPNYINLHNNLGLTYMDLKRYADAEKHLRHALLLNPEYANGMINMGALYARQQQYQQSVEMYRKALTFKPDSQVARGGLEANIRKLNQLNANSNNNTNTNTNTNTEGQ